MIDSLPQFESRYEERPAKPYWPRWRVFGNIGAIAGSVSAIALLWYMSTETGASGDIDDTGQFWYAIGSFFETIFVFSVTVITGALGYAAGAALGSLIPGKRGR